MSIQGTADLLMSLCGGAAFASGFVRRAAGFHMLANLAALAAGMLLVTAWAYDRSTRAAGAEAAVAD